MSKGRKPFVVIPLDTGEVYCGAYRCAGDCGLPHNQQERLEHFTKAGQAAERKRLTLAAFDALKAADRRQRIDAQQAVRKRAKDAL